MRLRGRRVQCVVVAQFSRRRRASQGANHHHHHHDDDDDNDDEVKTEQHLNELRLRNKIIDQSGVNASSVTVASE